MVNLELVGTAEELIKLVFVNVKLWIVQVKLRFHGGSRGKERVKELVSQVTERVLLVLCF